MIFLKGSSVHILCTQLYYICFIWVLDGGCWAKMRFCNSRGTKKVENHWFSTTASNGQQRQEQSFRTVRTTTPERKGSHLARKFACSWFHLLPLWWLFVWSFIKKSCVWTCWKKWRPFYIFLGVIHQQWLMKCIFAENGRILGKSLPRAPKFLLILTALFGHQPTYKNIRGNTATRSSGLRSIATQVNCHLGQWVTSRMPKCPRQEDTSTIFYEALVRPGLEPNYIFTSTETDKPATSELLACR